MTPTEYGWFLGEDEEYRYECWPMFFNDRLVCIPKKDRLSAGWDFGWCFEQNHGLTVAAAFAVWDPEIHSEPVGWHKRASGNIRQAPYADVCPDSNYNRPRCVHGDYIADGCERDEFCRTRK